MTLTREQIAGTAWVVANRNGDLMMSTIARTRRDAIRNMCDDLKAWRWWKRQGCHCVQVAVLPLAGEVAK